MNKLLSSVGGNLGAALQNPHVSVSVVGIITCEIGKIWLPQYATQFSATQKVIEGYALLAASNSGPKPNEKTPAPPATPAA